MSDDLRERLDLLAETDPLALRDEALSLLDRVEQAGQQQTEGLAAAEAVAADGGPLASLLTDVILDDLRKARPDAPPDEDERQAARELAAAIVPAVMEARNSPALIYVAGTAPLVARVDADAFNPGHLSRWDLAVCKTLLDLALAKIAQHEHEISTGIRALSSHGPEADRG